MTEDQILDIGFECLKLHSAPHVFLWLADEKWEGAYQVEAVGLEGNRVRLKMTKWREAQLVTEFNPN